MAYTVLANPIDVQILMADRNLNQEQQSHQNWDRDKDENRLNQDNQ